MDYHPERLDYLLIVKDVQLCSTYGYAQEVMNGGKFKLWDSKRMNIK
jgi:hypothetical protein